VCKGTGRHIRRSDRAIRDYSRRSDFPKPPEAQRTLPVEEKLRQVIGDKAAYAASIVQRWQDIAKADDRWDDNFAKDLYDALISLQPETLLAAGEASNYNRLLTIVASNRKTQTVLPRDLVGTKSLGNFRNDLVYTPIAPCRIVDTRNVGGPIAANTTRSFDVDVAPGGNYAFQGGVNIDCGIPNDTLDAVTAIEATVTVTQAGGTGYLTTWAVGFSQPLSSVINYTTGATLAASTIIPVSPGSGNDINVFAGSAGTQVIIDVTGYFAAPLVTPLDCITANSALTPVPVNVYTAVDAVCPVGRTATGGGWFSNEGTLGYPGVWTQSLPGAAYSFNGWRIWVDNQTSGPRNVQAWAVCCRVPGR